MTALAVALIVTAVFALTFEVLTVNVALVAPAGIVTLPGTPAALGLLLAKATVTPVLPETRTVATVLVPPTTVVDARVREVGVGGGALAVTVIGAEVSAAPIRSVTVNRAT